MVLMSVVNLQTILELLENRKIVQLSYLCDEAVIASFNTLMLHKHDFIPVHSQPPVMARTLMKH